jgi:predicted Zn-dependent protease with MMP-like domain
MKRMSLKKFGSIVARVMKSLPKEFKPYIRNVVVDVETEPDPKMLRRSGYSEQEIAGVNLLGLFAPLNSTGDLPSEDDEDEDMHEEFYFDQLDQPHRLIIYKCPHERSFPEPKQFLVEIRKTVIHELAHHFGWTDRDLDRFDNTPDPFGDGFERFL